MDINFVNIAIFAVIVLAAIGKLFFNVFLKPFTGRPAAPGAPPSGKSRELRDFLEELQRDLGHGKTEMPKTDGLLDDSSEEARPPPLQPAPPLPEVIAPAPPRLPRPVRQPPARAQRRPPAEAERQESLEREMQRRLASQLRAAASRSAADASAPEPAKVAASAEADAVLRVLESQPEAAVVLVEIFGRPRALRGPRRAF